jgi:hypothetical protein
VVFILVGVAHWAVARMGLSTGAADADAFLRQFDIAVLWFLFGGTFVALSRLWGELAEMSAASKKDTDPTS